jgi:phosphohistidine phosphatase
LPGPTPAGAWLCISQAIPGGWPLPRRSLMDLYLLRHGIAIERGTPGYEDDADRPLTEDGEKKVHRAARGMRALDLNIDLILSSPYLRCRQTTNIVASELQAGDKVRFSGALAPEGTPQDLIEEINREHSACDSLMLVGHEPYLSQFAGVLVSGSWQLGLTMKKGGLCRLTTDTLRYTRCAVLEWLLTPSQLGKLRAK